MSAVKTAITFYFVVLFLALLSASADAAIPKKKPCDQFMYDQIYKSIIQTALKEDLTAKTFEERNWSIRNLRLLCRGQLSTFERPGACDAIK